MASAAMQSIDKTKQWEMELLMEKLRSKASQFKSFVDTAKAVRSTLLEKRYPIDGVERGQLQKCLDTLQHSIKVSSLQGMLERLESVSRQLGLKFVAGPSGFDCFISSDMFYLEIVLEASGSVKDVKIHHEGKVEQQSCEELVSCLSRGDFSDFTVQLEGLASIYQLNAEKKVKCKAFSALQSLENDLSTLAQLQTFIVEPFNLIHKSPVGILEKRKGGHPMRLTYLVSPYDLLDQKSRMLQPLSVEDVVSKKLGYSVNVCMEGSMTHKLQIVPLISVTQGSDGRSSPLYAPINANNSAVLPAYFVLRLNNPLPMSLTLVQKIQEITGMECGDLSSPHPLLSLITQHASAGLLDSASNRGLFVSLPDQHHCYFMTESKRLEGVLVTNIPFSHPAHIPQILVYLRQQALFNVLIGSCVRPSSKQDLEQMIMFEVTALSWQHLSVSFEHPVEETMTTAELDLTDIGDIKCKVYGSYNDTTSSPENIAKVTNILQRCWSIPVTMRALIHLWQTQTSRLNGPSISNNFNLPPGNDLGRHGSNNDHSVTDFDIGRVKSEPDDSVSHGHSVGSGHSGFESDMMETVGFQNSMEVVRDEDLQLLNPADFGAAVLESPHSKSTDIFDVLSENICGTKQRKRKSADGMWRSPKRKQSGDNDAILESPGSDSNSLGTPTPKDVPVETDMDYEMEKKNSEFREEDILDLEDVEEMLSVRKIKKERKTSQNILLDLAENKALVPPSLSITAIPSSTACNNPSLSGMALERRSGVEIFPVSSGPTPPLANSITITPIPSKNSGDDTNKDRKNSKSKSDEKSRLERKKKRKREESPGSGSMGPPDKVPTKQDPLSKPVSVSIKPATESPPLSSARPGSPAGAVKKYSSSPTHMSLSVTKSSSKNPSSHQSPKHSPGCSTSSPKHHGISSPKHQSSGSSGKPSMSALKSAANSPSQVLGSKGNSGDNQKVKTSTSSSSSCTSKEKDRKTSSSSVGSSSPKLKSSSVKLKQLDLGSNVGEVINNISSSGSTAVISVTESNKSTPQARNRKGSLSAVIDKLKSAQHCGSDIGDPGKEVRNSGSGGGVGNKGPGDNSKNPGEYMVKPSSDGMKITINKTRTKDLNKSGSAKNLSNISSGSPKTHTGLKPGVNSGPASKKPHQVLQKPLGGSGSSSNSSSNLSGSKSGGSSSKSQLNTKSGSSPTPSISKSKSCSSPKMSGVSDLSKREGKPKQKIGSDRLFKSSDSRKLSPVTKDDLDSDRPLKSKLESSLPAQLVVGGFMKALDTNFQIPKLSTRLNAASDDKKSSDKVISGDYNRNEILKPLDATIKPELPGTKYNTKLSEELKSSKSSSSSSSLTTPSNLQVSGNSNSKSLSSISLQLAKSADKNTDNTAQISSSLPVISIVPITGVSMGETIELSSNRAKLEVRTPQMINMMDDSQSGSKTDSSKTFPPSDNSTVSLVVPGKDGMQTKYLPNSKQLDQNKFIMPISDMSKTVSKKMNPSTSSQEAAELLLDFSSSSTSVASSLPSKSQVSDLQVNKMSAVPERVLSSVHRNTPPLPTSMFPASPSVSIHIMKSPAASPLILPSPHSVSPCITDDELMDEALVGMGK